MYKIKSILIVFVFFLLSCVSGSQMKLSSDYIWTPETADGRKLRNLFYYTLEDVYKGINSISFPLQKDGIGLTTSYKCQHEKCSEDDINEVWLYTISHLDIVINQNDYDKLNMRVRYILNRRLPDIIFALRNVDFSSILDYQDFEGFLFTFTWGVKDYKNGVFEKTEYETARIYVPKKTYIAYVNKSINLITLIRSSHIYGQQSDGKKSKLTF